MNDWTVWVGGDEVNNYYLTKDKAKDLAMDFIADGYEDVQIENLSDDKNYQLKNNKWEYMFTAREYYKEEVWTN